MYPDSIWCFRYFFALKYSICTQTFKLKCKESPVLAIIPSFFFSCNYIQSLGLPTRLNSSIRIAILTRTQPCKCSTFFSFSKHNNFIRLVSFVINTRSRIIFLFYIYDIYVFFFFFRQVNRTSKWQTRRTVNNRIVGTSVQCNCQ